MDEIVLDDVLMVLSFLLFLQLLHLGRGYPKGEVYFRECLRKGFLANKDETDPQKIKNLVGDGETVIKDLKTLYVLKEVRAIEMDRDSTSH